MTTIETAIVKREGDFFRMDGVLIAEYHFHSLLKTMGAEGWWYAGILP